MPGSRARSGWGEARAARGRAMSRSRSRTVRASPAQWARVRERAEEARMNVSRFVAACALYGEPGAPVPGVEDRPGTPELALGEVEQRELHEAARRMDACCRAIVEQIPGASMSVLEALDFVQRCHALLAQEREAVRGEDGQWLG